jgi:predicted regulator of Ras-like GTPase activity (Roadblock/LC7/MglB family)
MTSLGPGDMKSKRHNNSSSFLTDEQLADIEALLGQFPQQQPNFIGALLAGHDGKLIVSLMPDHIDLDSMASTAMRAFRNGEPQKPTEVHCDEGFVSIADAGAGLLVILTSRSVHDLDFTPEP